MDELRQGNLATAAVDAAGALLAAKGARRVNGSGSSEVPAVAETIQAEVVGLAEQAPPSAVIYRGTLGQTSAHGRRVGILRSALEVFAESLRRIPNKRRPGSANATLLRDGTLILSASGRTPSSKYTQLLYDLAVFGREGK